MRTGNFYRAIVASFARYTKKHELVQIDGMEITTTRGVYNGLRCKTGAIRRGCTKEGQS